MSARAKIVKPAGVNPDELEMQVAQAIFDLENGSTDLKADLRPLQFTAAKEVCLSFGGGGGVTPVRAINTRLSGQRGSWTKSHRLVRARASIEAIPQGPEPVSSFGVEV